MRDAPDGRLLPQQRRAATRLNIDRITRALDLIVSFATTFTQAVDAADAFTNQLQELTSNSHYLPRFLDKGRRVRDDHLASHPPADNHLTGCI